MPELPAEASYARDARVDGNNLLIYSKEPSRQGQRLHLCPCASSGIVGVGNYFRFAYVS